MSAEQEMGVNGASATRVDIPHWEEAYNKVSPENAQIVFGTIDQLLKSLKYHKTSEFNFDKSISLEQLFAEESDTPNWVKRKLGLVEAYLILKKYNTKGAGKAASLLRDIEICLPKELEELFINILVKEQDADKFLDSTNLDFLSSNARAIDNGRFEDVKLALHAWAVYDNPEASDEVIDRMPVNRLDQILLACTTCKGVLCVNKIIEAKGYQYKELSDILACLIEVRCISTGVQMSDEYTDLFSRFSSDLQAHIIIGCDSAHNMLKLLEVNQYAALDKVVEFICDIVFHMPKAVVKIAGLVAMKSPDAFEKLVPELKKVMELERGNENLEFQKAKQALGNILEFHESQKPVAEAASAGKASYGVDVGCNARPHEVEAGLEKKIVKMVRNGTSLDLSNLDFIVKKVVYNALVSNLGEEDPNGQFHKILDFNIVDIINGMGNNWVHLIKCATTHSKSTSDDIPALEVDLKQLLGGSMNITDDEI